MISKTAEYALRVAVILQRHVDRGPVLGKEIAGQSEVPGAYVNTILNRMVHAGFVAGDRGPGGGYRLTRPGAQISVHDIVSIFDDVDAQRHCVLGHAICEGSDGCPVHDMWGDVLVAYDRFLNEMTLERLASIKSVAGPTRKRRVKAGNTAKKRVSAKSRRKFQV